MAPLVSLEASADPGRFPLLRKLVGAAARTVGASSLDATDLEISTAEALVNVFLHAYGGQAGPVTIHIDFDGASIAVRVEDRGRGRAPGTDGQGLRLIRELSDASELSPRADGAGMVLAFRRRVV